MENNHNHHIAEVQKIAHILGITEESLDFLSVHPQEKLSYLRHHISSAIQSEQSGVWEPLAKVTKFFPNFLNAKVSEEVLGPHITANITYHVNVKDAINISNFFSLKFFADVMEHVLPERVEPILDAAPPEKMKQVLIELLKRKNYAQISGLMDYTPVEKAAKLTLEVKDYAVLSDVAFYSEKRTRLWQILATYSDERNIGFIRAVVKDGREDMLKEIIESADSSFQAKLKSLIANMEEEIKKAIL